MTYKSDCALPEALLKQIAQEGFDVLPDLVQTVINMAMQIERQRHLGVGPYERSAKGQGNANGYKPKTVSTRVGKITFDMPGCVKGILPALTGKGAAQRLGFEVSLGRDVCARRLHPQSGRDHRATVRLLSHFDPGEPGNSRIG